MNIYLALTLQKMNRYEEALDQYNLAIQKNPENSVNYNNKGLAMSHIDS